MIGVQIIYSSIKAGVMVLLDELQQQSGEAQLIGRSGEVLKRYVLQNGINHLSLCDYPPGKYALRVSTEKDVTVKEIIIENKC